MRAPTHPGEARRSRRAAASGSPPRPEPGPRSATTPLPRTATAKREKNSIFFCEFGDQFSELAGPLSNWSASANELRARQTSGELRFRGARPAAFFDDGRADAARRPHRRGGRGPGHPVPDADDRAERADRALVGAEEAEADCGVRQVRRVLPRRLRPLPELLRQAQVRRPRCAPQVPPGLQTSPRLRAARRAPPKGPGNCARATNTPQTAPTDPAASRARRATPRAPVAPPPPRKLLAPLISLDGSNGASASSR